MKTNVEKELAPPVKMDPLDGPIADAAVAEPGLARRDSYGQIVKSSALIGGSSAINIALGIVRTKAMAVLLGPSGFGLMGLYTSIVDLAQSIAGMGLTSSGVRQIAEASGSGDANRVARTATVLRRISVLLGLAGAALLFLLSRQISILTFGTGGRGYSVALLSLAVFFGAISAGQTALIQGTRRIADLAKLSIIGGLLGTVISIPIVYFFREQGVVPALVTVAAAASLTSWWYGQKIKMQVPSMTAGDVRTEVVALLKLGVAFAAVSLLTMGAAYVIRMLVVRKVGLGAAGLYHSAWVLGGLYIGFILQAMGTDFYPRLTGKANDNAECNRLVNEQAQVSLLLAGPGILATLTFAPFVISLFYSERFEGAIDILRWICLGMALRVITWPMGFILLAKGEQKMFFWAEVAYTAVHLALAWMGLVLFGLNGAGIAFFGSYIFHGLLIYPIVRRSSGFRWSPATLRTGLYCFALIAVVFCGLHTLPPMLSATLGTIAFLIGAIYSVRTLLTLTDFDGGRLRRWMVRLGLARAG